MLKAALITEKTMRLASVGSYTFWVERGVGKREIAKLVAKKFGVDVVKVASVNLPPKRKSYRTRRGSFRVAGKRKAIVSLKSGQKIDLFEKAIAESSKGGDDLVTTAETVKEKKSLLGGTKVKIEKGKVERTRQLPGKTKGEK